MQYTNAYKAFKNDAKLLGRFVADLLIKELIGQGHKLDGNLVNSVAEQIVNTEDHFNLNINTLKYGLYLNYGVKPERVRVPISVLEEYVRKSNFAPAGQEKSIAFAIRNKMQKYGMPIPLDKRSPGGASKVKNGRVLGWIKYITDNYGDKILQQAQDINLEYIDNVFTEIFDGINKRYDNIIITKA